ncbi:MAG: hypothetical protein Q4C95_12525 [Planctomycetia bacterium]|nr:hypothetical protein [Planctomycetia bacterium]
MKSQNNRLFQSFATLLPIDLGDLEAHFFAIPHDTGEPVGYRFSNGKVSVAIATDIGHITSTLRKNLFCVKVVLSCRRIYVQAAQNIRHIRFNRENPNEMLTTKIIFPIHQQCALLDKCWTTLL